MQETIQKLISLRKEVDELEGSIFEEMEKRGLKEELLPVVESIFDEILEFENTEAVVTVLDALAKKDRASITVSSKRNKKHK